MPDFQNPDSDPNAGDRAFASVDLNRTPVAGSPFAPDFHPALQPLAQGYGPLFPPQRALGPGLLGSREDIRRAIAAGAGNDDRAPDTSLENVAAKIRQRDIDYLDRYYSAVSKYADRHKVNPAFPLGLGIESGFATDGTYLKTGDAFGMTGGSTAHMTHSSSPDDNARRLFDLYGSQIYGVGDDADAFINAMQGRNAKGQPVPGWRVYNSINPEKWETMARSGVAQMQRDLPIYLPMRKPKTGGGS